MILVTGSSGFIGSHLVTALGQCAGAQEIALCDPRDSEPNYEWLLAEKHHKITAVFHMGAISDTTCDDLNALYETNVCLSRRLARFCQEKKIPFIYASSASVYGNGDGPLNGYAASKLLFDNWALDHLDLDWYGCRFFNVYGPGEGHKGKQASMVWQMYEAMRDGERPQLFALAAERDFIHVDDVVKIMLWMWQKRPASGIYDVGTGAPLTFEELFDMVEKAKDISHGYDEIEMPASLVGKYQTFTCASLAKLTTAGFDARAMLSPWQGIKRFIDAEDRIRQAARPPPAPQRGLGL